MDTGVVEPAGRLTVLFAVLVARSMALMMSVEAMSRTHV
jgi:hypothetical protein